MEGDPQPSEETIALEAPADGVFVPPSIDEPALLAGDTYTYYCPVPPSLLAPSSSSSTSSSPPSQSTSQQQQPADDTNPAPAPAAGGPPCVLGVDEAGRGPVLGPMVYGVFYLPAPLSDPLLRTAHHFDDSKVLTPAVRSALMQALCDPGSDLHSSCGWAVSALSARDIGAGMLRGTGGTGAATYNLNAQAFDATVALIRGVMARGVNVREIYVDTVGPPKPYQARLERVFPTARITVASKADSLYPCVSAASVCAKVTRDVALEVQYGIHARAAVATKADGEGAMDVDDDGGGKAEEEEVAEEGWGSGYPSDARCTAWLRRNMHPVFGWGPECRFSWGTVKDMLESNKGNAVRVEWPVDDDGESTKMTDFFVSDGDRDKDSDELGAWFGTPVGLEAF
ncbi:uncharacterized protein E0L32_008809 [Thyridium curvatum]|uniref:Ribonuclease n=1 Tax=Thyridium curvatum TaxID=1093900 RepID=A0A507AK91_9PEZI|nr:uncharacterized protein E0L32_008809 [Thyridium curvatum]TPX09962.1 hypothetical protein E0L32_008809 [Thyridium curvatum]